MHLYSRLWEEESRIIGSEFGSCVSFPELRKIFKVILWSLGYRICRGSEKVKDVKCK